MRKFLQFVLGSITMAVVAVIFAVTVIEWIAGCGGYYVDAWNRKVYRECVIIPYNPTDEPLDGETGQ